MRPTFTVLITCGVAALMVLKANADTTKDYPVKPVPFTAVHPLDTFWAPRIETNRRVTVPYDFQKCEETGRIDNFAKAGGLMDGPFEGIRFNDSDVFKVVEGAAYSLAQHPDPELDAYLDALIAKFAAAQEEDGYLYTTRTIDPKHPADAAGKDRWTYLQQSHELYNVGHMYEAAVAHYLATGKRSFLDVAIKNADLIDRVFAPGKKYDVPGHEEIEIGLAKLYRATGNARYLELAKFFLDQRGNDAHRKPYGAYCQDHIPVTQQGEAVGHAVRAGYLYSGMADVAALTGDTAYVAAIDRIWADVVEKKLYLTGAIGARRSGEAFGDAFELPNLTAYNETCASIANAMWNHRMFLLHGDAKYLDVLERVLYNGFLAGVSMTGDTFFYPNPLECDGAYPFNHGSLERQPWFGCSCCPSNVVRFMPSLPGYVYAQQGRNLYVNLFMAGEAAIEMAGQTVHVRQDTRYPWDGAVTITIEPETPLEFTLYVHIPSWAEGHPVPGGLYRYLNYTVAPVEVAVNGEAVLKQGFCRIHRTWSKGDTVGLTLPMPVRRVVCHEKVTENAGKVALQRGPLVYCAEWKDNGGRVLNLALPDSVELTAEHRDDLLGGVTVIEGTALALYREKDGKGIREEQQPFLAIPYYAWAHRGAGEMAVWLPRDAAAVAPAPLPTLASTSRASASHTWQGDSTAALNDLREPANSNDQGLLRFTWWAHKGGTEWVQYDLEQPATVSAVEVYWFDDAPGGGCRVPESWRLLYRRAPTFAGGAWAPIPAADAYGIKKDCFNRAAFTPLETDALRIEVELRPGFSGGILEWRVE